MNFKSSPLAADPPVHCPCFLASFHIISISLTLRPLFLTKPALLPFQSACFVPYFNASSKSPLFFLLSRLSLSFVAFSNFFVRFLFPLSAKCISKMVVSPLPKWLLVYWLPLKVIFMHHVSLLSCPPYFMVSVKNIFDDLIIQNPAKAMQGD